MYRCNSCKTLFEEPHECIEETGVTADLGAFGSMSEVISYEVCPECGSEDFEGAPQCDICDGYEYMSEGETVCEACKSDMEGLIAIAFSNFEKMHPKATEDDMYYMLYELWNEYDERN